MFDTPRPSMQDTAQSTTQRAPDKELLRKRHILRDVVFIGAFSTPIVMYGLGNLVNKDIAVFGSQLALAAGIYFLATVALATISAMWGRQPKRLRRRRMLWDALWLGLTWHLPCLVWTYAWLIVLVLDFVILGIGLYLSLLIAPSKDIDA